MVSRIEQRPREIPQTTFRINEVPLVTQKYGNWCGYASLSMVLQYWGYTDLTPENIFLHLNEDFDEESLGDKFAEETPSFLPGPTVDTLALAVEELTALKADILDGKLLKILEEKGRSPHDVLQAYVIGRGTPCIVRMPSHFIVVTGVDIENNRYFFNDPLPNSLGSTLIETFEHEWRKREPKYVRDTSHLMLAIYPQEQERPL